MVCDDGLPRKRGRDDPIWVSAAVLAGLGRSLSHRDEMWKKRGVWGHPCRARRVRCRGRREGDERPLRHLSAMIEA
jgi:hypothetical protein